MVQSSIIISTATSSSARKRSIDSANNTENAGNPDDEVNKRYTFDVIHVANLKL